MFSFSGEKNGGWVFLQLSDSEFKIEYAKDLNISLSNYILKLGDNKDDPYKWFDNIKLEKIFTFEYEEDNLFRTCFKITPITSLFFESGANYVINLKQEFKESLTYDKLPQIIYMCLTSEENAYGAIYDDWRNGDEYYMKFEKVKMFHFCDNYFVV